MTGRRFIGRRRHRAVTRRPPHHRVSGAFVLLMMAQVSLWLPSSADAIGARWERAAGSALEQPRSTSYAAASDRDAAPAGQAGADPAADRSDMVARAGFAAPSARRSDLYDLAAQRYGVSAAVLWALHQVESSALRGGCLANRQGSGAIGPFQFKPATFRAYGVDADGDGRADACAFADSLFSAARYLEALGADADPASAATRRALQRYGTDAARVVALAS